MKYLFLLVLLISSCATGKKVDSKENTGPVDEFLSYAESLKKSVESNMDEFGFVHSDKCDALLFTGLVHTEMPNVDIFSARDDQGNWFRTPYKDCFFNEKNQIDSSRKSKTPCSRDQIIGLLWGLFANNDLSGLDQVYRDLKARKWVICQGSLDRTFFTINNQKTLYLLTNRGWKGPPSLWVDPINDHDRHIVALNISLRGEKEGSIDESALKLIRKFAKKDQKNLLYKFIIARYTDGDQSKVAAEALELAKRIPIGERCEKWLWERDSKKWENCSNTEMAYGGDMLFLAHLIKRATKN